MKHISAIAIAQHTRQQFLLHQRLIGLSLLALAIAKVLSSGSYACGI